MRTLWIFVAAFALCSCVEDVYKGPQEEPGNTEYNDFDFSTVASDINLEVGYRNMGVEAAVYFEVYDENPVEWTEHSYRKRTDIEPLYAAYTGEDGVFRGKVDLPAYMKKAYIYTPAFYARTLIEADVVNGTVVATDDEPETRANGDDRRTGGNGVCYMVEGQNQQNYRDTRWKTWLGTYTREGYVNYEYAGGELSIDNMGDLYTAHSMVINVNHDCPERYRSYQDLYLNEQAEIAVAFLGQNTCWNCSLGYYYYRETEGVPENLNEAHVILLFPNTQDGKWTNNLNSAKATRGIERGTTVQLMYYPNIAEGSQEGATSVFPAGYRIGFVLANNAWSERVAGFKGNNLDRTATSKGLSVNGNGSPYGEPRTAAYKNTEEGVTIISFEDYHDDENFSDVVIAMKTNPVDAVSDVPDVDPDEIVTTTNELQGIYAFEDLWPDNGDYDMNDVLVRYHYGKLYDIYEEVHAETFTFKTFSNYAGNNNGLAFTLPEGFPVTRGMKYEIKLPGAEDFTEANFTYEEETRTFLLTDNVKTNMGAEYRVTLNYEKPFKLEEGKVRKAQVFIYKPGAGDGRWEVHIAREAPTSKMDDSYFGTGDDSSNPGSGLYYVNNTNYPFAFFLAGATEDDLSNLLVPENESVPISELYPQYINWSESKGAENADWYKE